MHLKSSCARRPKSLNSSSNKQSIVTRQDFVKMHQCSLQHYKPIFFGGQHIIFHDFAVHLESMPRIMYYQTINAKKKEKGISGRKKKSWEACQLCFVCRTLDFKYLLGFTFGIRHYYRCFCIYRTRAIISRGLYIFYAIFTSVYNY